MKKILFIAPSSYPIFQPEAMVNAKHLKLLLEMGCVIDLVTRGVRERFELYPPSEDDFFFKGLNSINLVPVKTSYNLKTLWRHILLYFKTGFVYKAADWAYEAIKVSEELIAENSYDYILTKDYPSEIVGVYLSKKYNLKWIPTWNDPYFLEKYPVPYGKGYNYPVSLNRKKLISHIGKNAFLHLFPSDRLRDYMLLYMDHMTKEKTVIMPHILFDKLKSSKPASQEGNEKKLSIIHAGALGRERDPESFFSALRLFLNGNPTASIEVTLLGVAQRVNSNFVDDLVQKYSLEKVVNFIPPVSYRESLDIVSYYNVCLLIEADLEEGIFLPSKIVDYLQNEKPILAVSPRNGVMADYHRRGIIPYLAPVDEPEEIKNVLFHLYNDFINNKIPKGGDCDFMKKAAIKDLHQKKIFI